MADFNSILAQMQRICSVREYCVYDIEQKLAKTALNTKEKGLIIKLLLSDKFVDNSRFASAFVRDKSRLSGWGPAKIKWHLRSKKIEDDIIRETVGQISKEESFNSLVSVLEKKRSTIKVGADKNRVRASLIRFALSRGFDYDSVVTQVNKVMVNLHNKSI